MDPWSKGDYSRHIREALMVVEKLPQINPPSGRVPGRGLLAIPISGSQRWRNRREFRCAEYFLGFLSCGVNIGRRGGAGKVLSTQASSWRSQEWGRIQR